MKSCVLILALLLAASPALRAQMDVEDINGVAVIVNEVVITYADVISDLAEDVRRLANLYGNQPDVYRQQVAAARKDRIEQLVENQLILHEFETAGYVLPESYIEERVQARIKEQFGDRATMTKSL
ncbi:MAG: hypothetical protein KGS61_16395, partial [Verrucomicrobia bacterium]|nr:hypothetical protein [Verrucomicrobiota bacterium]